MRTQKLKTYFIGIGGIGVSALAKYYLEKGYEVSGSDLVFSEITNALEKMGAKIFIGRHKAGNVPKDTDLVIYSSAVPKNNPELSVFLNQHPRLVNQPRVLSYPKALGELTKKYFTIAVSGTHGKSTTTSMIALILDRAGFDPTVIVGTKIKEFDNSNCRVGKSKYLVIEADEWQASFLKYFPKIIVLTNIEKEHLDYYKNLKNILKTFQEYIGHLPKDGILVANGDDANISKMNKFIRGESKKQKSKLQFKIKNYYLKQSEAKILKRILKIPGEHNVFNALAALTVARILKIPDEISFKALSKYKGSWRRFEITETLYPKPCTLISDYAHHPTEIEATLKAAREKFPKRKIWCIFQPHQYQRTFYLFDDFVRVFSSASVDKIIIADIYDVAGREKKLIKKKVSSEKLAKEIQSNRLTIKKNSTMYIPTIQEIADYLKKNLKGGEVVIIMGAGDIYKLAP